MNAFAAIPIRSFSAMERLATVLDDARRASLIRDLAAGVVRAAHDVGVSVAVVTADDEVAKWASRTSIDVIADPGEGLDAAAAAALHHAGNRRWLVVHADLPWIRAEDVAAMLDGPLPAISPSLDGGTSAISGRKPAFPFRFGPGSFRRHVSAVPNCRVVVRRGLAVDIDRPRDLDVVNELGNPSLPRETLPQ